MSDEDIINRLADALCAEVDAIKATGVAVKNLHTYGAAITILAEGISEEREAQTRAALVEDLTGKLCSTVNRMVAAAPGRVQ